MFTLTVSAHFYPPPLASDVLAHYPVFRYLSNVTANRAFFDLVSAFEDVFTSVLLRNSEDFGSNLLQPLPIDLVSKEFYYFSWYPDVGVSQLASSLLAVHLQAPESSLQTGRIDRLFAYIKANLTRGKVINLKLNSRNLKIIFFQNGHQHILFT